MESLCCLVRGPRRAKGPLIPYFASTIRLPHLRATRHLCLLSSSFCRVVFAPSCCAGAYACDIRQSSFCFIHKTARRLSSAPAERETSTGPVLCRCARGPRLGRINCEVPLRVVMAEVARERAAIHIPSKPGGITDIKGTEFLRSSNPGALFCAL